MEEACSNLRSYQQRFTTDEFIAEIQTGNWAFDMAIGLGNITGYWDMDETDKESWRQIVWTSYGEEEQNGIHRKLQT